jgi:hypothetical protein
MQKLTKAQATALALIEDNPRGVEAITRLRRDMLRINGNVEHTLRYSGWVEPVSLGRHERVERGQTLVTVLFAWKLTEAGRTALRSTL